MCLPNIFGQLHRFFVFIIVKELSHDQVNVHTFEIPSCQFIQASHIITTLLTLDMCVKCPSDLAVKLRRVASQDMPAQN